MFPFAETPLPDPQSASSIGWVCLAIAGIIGAINQALKLTDRFKTKDPNPPLHKEYASKEQHDELSRRVEDMAQDVQENFKDLREERSRSSARLYERIEKFDSKNQEITAGLRKEMKDDIAGVHNRITDAVSMLSQMRGALQAWVKSSNSTPPI